MSASFSLHQAGGLLVVALASTALANAATIKPFSDSQCTKPITNYTTNKLGNPNQSTFTIDNAWPTADVYAAPTFADSAASSGGSGSQVYWQIPDPGLTCRYVMMTDYTEENYVGLGQVPYGNVIMNAEHSGCIFSNLLSGNDLMLSYCCGAGDCANYAAGNAALYRRSFDEVEERTTVGSERTIKSRAAEKEREKEKRVAAAATAAITAPTENISWTEKLRRSFSDSLPSLHTGSSTTRAFALRRDTAFDTSKCKAVDVEGGTPQAGKQVMVAAAQHCTTAPCTFSVSGSVSTSTSLTSTSSQTITNTAGGSIAIKTGVDLFVEADVTATASYSFAKAIGTSTAQTVQNGTTTTVTNTVGQQLGTSAFVTFTPTYLCWMAKIDCGKGPSESAFTFCNPQMDSDGKTVQGDFTVVYTG